MMRNKHLQFSRPRYMLSFSVFTKLNFRIDQRNKWVFALIFRRRWKHFRPSEQRLRWSNSAERRWMISLAGMQWGFFGALDTVECKAMRSPMSSRGAAPFRSFSDLSRLWESLDEAYREGCRLLINQHWARWRGLNGTQRQARELIPGSSLAAKVKLLYFNRTQPRAVTDLLTGHNTLRRHLHLLGLLGSPLCRRCGVKETSSHILCECEALASLRHKYLGSFFLEPEDIKSISLRAIWNFGNVTGTHELAWGTKGLSLRPRCVGTVSSRTQARSIYLSLLETCRG